MFLYNDFLANVTALVRSGAQNNRIKILLGMTEFITFLARRAGSAYKKCVDSFGKEILAQG